MMEPPPHHTIPEALLLATASVDQCRHALSGDPESRIALADALEARADIHLQSGDPTAAMDDNLEAIACLQEIPASFKQLGRLHVNLGAALDSLGESERAATHWEKALECFERQQPPSHIAAATIANNLGYLKRNAGDFDGAETAYLKSLEIFHTHCGPHHEQTATVAANLGSLYQIAGYYPSACEMHTLATEACRVCHGEGHPQTGQSYHHLALALASTGERTEARRYYQLALDIFEPLGPDHQADLTAIAENYTHLLHEDGDTETADAITRRIRRHSASS